MKILFIFLICFFTNIYAVTFQETFKTKQSEISQFIDFTPASSFRAISQSRSFGSGEELYCWQYPNEFIPDPDLGYRHRPNSQVRHICRTANEIVFDAIYSFDQYGRRYAKIENQQDRKKFIILSGCSFTYGNTINDDETLNFFLAQELSDFFPHNYGIGATGANHTLALVSSNRFKEEIKQESGYFFYIYIPDHVPRTSGYLPSLMWLKDSPYYEIESNNEVVRKGSFKSGRPLYTNFLLKLSSWLPFFRGKVFPNISNDDYLYTCRLIVESKKRFIDKYPTSHFVLLNHPLISRQLDPVLEKCLKNNQVAIIQNFKELGYYPRTQLYTPYDGHPNSKMNQIIANAIKDYINKSTSYK